MPLDTTRFTAAQEKNNTYGIAKKELENGQKTSHWIWYIFPQLLGLGHSKTAIFYGIPTLQDAIVYLNQPKLLDRYIEMASIVHQKICIKNINVTTLMNGQGDALKLGSSLTLFLYAAQQIKNRATEKDDHLETIKQVISKCAEILQKIGDCKKTATLIVQLNVSPTYRTVSSPKPSFMQHDATPQNRPIPPKSFPINMHLLGVFITVLGVAAVAIAFTLLHAATFGIPGLILTSVGLIALLAGVGLFKKDSKQPMPAGVQRVAGTAV